MPGTDTPSAAPDQAGPATDGPAIDRPAADRPEHQTPPPGKAGGTDPRVGAAAGSEGGGETDPTQAPPPHIEGDAEAQRILDQQHTGNHGKPGAEQGASDRRGGTREGAGTVEPETPAGNREGRTGT